MENELHGYVRQLLACCNPSKYLDVPQWKIPDIEVVVRRTGREDADDDAQEEWVDEDISDEEYGDMGELADDSVWYKQVVKVPAKNVPHAEHELKRLKRKFHRSRIFRYDDPQDLKGEREPGTYYTNSGMVSAGKVDEDESVCFRTQNVVQSNSRSH